MTERKQGRREMSSMESREAILNAALQLFAETGFHGTSIRLIAREANVSEGLIYHHFKDKVDLFTAIFQAFMTLTPQTLQEHFQASQKRPETLEEFLHSIFQMASQEFGRGKMKLLFRVVLSSFFLLPPEDKERFVRMVHEQFINQLQSQIEPWLPEHLKKENDSYLYLRLIQGAIMGFYLYQEVLGWKEFVEVDFEDYSRVAAQVLSRGIQCGGEGEASESDRPAGLSGPEEGWSRERKTQKND